MLSIAFTAEVVRIEEPIDREERSPDGSQLLYERRSGAGLWVANADLTNPTKVASDTNRTPVWSPDGSQLLYGDDDGLWVVNADGTNPTKVVTSGGFLEWSPDGSKLAYAICPEWSCQIWVVNADGTNPTQIASDFLNDYGWLTV